MRKNIARPINDSGYGPRYADRYHVHRRELRLCLKESMHVRRHMKKHNPYVEQKPESDFA